MKEGKTPKLSSCPWFQDCVAQVQIWICQDRTTTNDDLHEKAENYTRNYLAIHPELSSINRDDVASAVADEVEKAFQNKRFDQRPPASVVAQNARKGASDRPEDKFIKLR